MEAFYQWVCRIAGYLVFLAVLESILPSRSYVRYLKLFSGCVLLLLVMQPVIGGLRLEGEVLSRFQMFSAQEELQALQQEISEAETRRIRVLTEACGQQLEELWNQELLKEGYRICHAEIQVETDRNLPDFGQIQRAEVTVCPASSGVSPVSVEAVRIPGVQPENAESRRLRKKLAALSGMEEQYVEVRMEN